jgi:hypothetical protein
VAVQHREPHLHGPELGEERVEGIVDPFWKDEAACTDDDDRHVRQCGCLSGDGRSEVDLIADDYVWVPLGTQLEQVARACTTQSRDEVLGHGSPFVVDVVNGERGGNRYKVRTSRSEGQPTSGGAPTKRRSTGNEHVMTRMDCTLRDGQQGLQMTVPTRGGEQEPPPH